MSQEAYREARTTLLKLYTSLNDSDPESSSPKALKQKLKEQTWYTVLVHATIHIQTVLSPYLIPDTKFENLAMTVMIYIAGVGLDPDLNSFLPYFKEGTNSLTKLHLKLILSEYKNIHEEVKKMVNDRSFHEKLFNKSS